MKKLALVAAVCVVMAGSLYAQQMDAAFGAGTVSELSSSNSISSFGSTPVSLNGGTYLNFSGDYLFYRGIFGVGGELGWRASHSFFQGIPYRPFFYDFNGVFAPKLGRSVQGEFLAGIGGEDVRFYNPAGGCGIGCTNFVSTNHFLGHLGAGIRFYVHGNFFIRPEAHLYLVHNNDEFTTGSPARYGVSIGYSFGKP